MASVTQGLIRQLTRAAGADDPLLLDQFLIGRDQEAFAELVRRHGPRVRAACRQVLGASPDADDAFQATFVIFYRKAGSIREGQSVGGWLYSVAHRVATHARVDAERRRRREQESARRAEPAPAGPDPSWREAVTVLHQELARLPEHYRLPLLLCYLEGKTRDEAAEQLGWSVSVLRGRLERGRNRLRGRLARRGVTLSAGLLAAMGDSAAVRAALTPTLVQSTLSAATTGRLSEPVAALIRGATPAMFPSGSKLAAVIAVGLMIAGAGLIAPAGAEPPAAPANAEPMARSDTPTEFTYAGTVIDPDNKPVAGAKLYLLYYTPKALPIPVRATTDAAGKFAFTLQRTDFDPSIHVGRGKPGNGFVTATAEGFGVAWVETGAASDLKLQLVKDDVPVTGKVVDLQGKPIAGITVTVHGIKRPVAADLTAFHDALMQKREGYELVNSMLHGMSGGWMGRDSGTLFPPVTTGADGRFTLKGVGRDRIVELRLESPTTEVKDVWVMTRASRSITVPAWKNNPDGDRLTWFGHEFEYAAAPSLPVEGVVRDKDTGKPIPGAVVYADKLATSNISSRSELRTVADAEGRYKMLGLPRGGENILRADPPEGQPYIRALKRVPEGKPLTPVTVDFALKRGVWVEGRAIDKATGSPVYGQVEYFTYPDNPNLKEAPGLATDHYLQNRADDGSFRVAVLPGKCLIAFRAQGDEYLVGVGADKISIKEERGHYPTRPHYCVARGYHRFVELDVPADAERVKCELDLDPGKAITGTVVGPDGKPLAGAHASGLKSYIYTYWQHEPLKGAEFTVRGLKPDEPRRVIFMQKDQRLVGTAVVKGSDKSVTVKAEPWATITGRYVDEDGRPRANATLMFLNLSRRPGDEARTDAGSHPERGFVTDKDGRFRIEGLVPGLKYSLADLGAGRMLLGHLFEELALQSGESKDLGDLKVKPFKPDGE